MTETAETALRASIKHWERLLLGHDTLMGPGACPLCQEFKTVDEECDGCPVYEHTGKPYCMGTPYDNAADHHKQGRSVRTARGLVAIWKELQFLRSLLPDKPTRPRKK